MHEFQTYPVNLLDFNPFEKIGNEWMLIAAGNEEKANAMTASWGGVGVLWGKNVAFIFVREKRYTKEFIDNGEVFSCTFFDKKYKNDLKYFGIVSGRQEDKFKTSGMTLNYKYHIPFVDEGNCVFLCKKMAAIPVTEAHFIDPEIKQKWYSKDDADNLHTLYIGEIVEIVAR